MVERFKKPSMRYGSAALATIIAIGGLGLLPKHKLEPDHTISDVTPMSIPISGTYASVILRVYPPFSYHDIIQATQQEIISVGKQSDRLYSQIGCRITSIVVEPDPNSATPQDTLEFTTDCIIGKTEYFAATADAS